jgi:predicted transcriptional regulator
VKAEGRVRIKLLVSLQPGLHLRELQRRIGLSFSSTRYHVDRLTKDGEIDRVEDNGYSRIYPAGLDERDRVLLSLVRRETDRRILSSFLRGNGLSQQRLTDLTGLAKSTVSEHLATLLKLGVLRTKTGGERRIFELADPAKIDTMLNLYPHLLGKATRRFIDLWDF